MKQRRPPQHRHVLVRHAKVQAEVDEGIADVIRETWRAGVATEECCQGRYEPSARCKRAYIVFHACEAERWMKIIAPDAPWMGTVDYSTYPPTVNGESEAPLSPDEKTWLRHHMLRLGSEGPLGKRWTHTLLPYDGWGTSVHYSVSIEFPATDLPDVLSRLKAYNRRSRSALKRPK
jgi:hypothetical protein